MVFSAFCKTLLAAVDRLSSSACSRSLSLNTKGESENTLTPDRKKDEHGEALHFTFNRLNSSVPISKFAELYIGHIKTEVSLASCH